MASADKVPMLAEGHRRLYDEAKRLKTIERPAVIEAIEVARAHGDLSENAEYHAAKERQGQVEAVTDRQIEGMDRVRASTFHRQPFCNPRGIRHLLRHVLLGNHGESDLQRPFSPALVLPRFRPELR